jgi:hypothetical protein
VLINLTLDIVLSTKLRLTASTTTIIVMLVFLTTITVIGSLYSTQLALAQQVRDSGEDITSSSSSSSDETEQDNGGSGSGSDDNTDIASSAPSSTNNNGGQEQQLASSSPSLSSAINFNFAAAGDWGCTSHTTDTVNNILDKKSELVLALGDFSYDEGSENCWFDIIQPINGITKIALGNHDQGSANLEELMNHFGLTKEYYSFDYHNVHFIALATEDEYLDMSNDKAQEQLAFVKSDLQKASTNPNIDWIIPFFHTMIYAKDPSALVGPFDYTLRETYHPIFDKYGVHLVLDGHTHAYERSYPLRANSKDSQNPIVTNEDSSNYPNIDGLVVATVGVGGAFHTPMSMLPQYKAIGNNRSFGFLNVDVYSDRRTLVGTFYDSADGEIKDQFTITK